MLANHAKKFLLGALALAVIAIAGISSTPHHVTASPHVDASQIEATPDASHVRASYVPNVQLTAEGHRCSLTSGTAITTSDVTGATHVYFTVDTSNRSQFYENGRWTEYAYSELDVSLGTLTNDKTYDVFAYGNNGVVAGNIGTNAWSGNATRTDAVATQDGRLVLSSDHSKLLICTIHTTSTTTTEDSISKRFVGNVFNTHERNLRVNESTVSWTDSFFTWRPARAQTSNSVEYVSPKVEYLEATVRTLTQDSSTGRAQSGGIGIDSTTTNSADIFGSTSMTTTTGTQQCIASYAGWTAVGYHRITWLEIADATGTVTFFGANSATGDAGSTPYLGTGLNAKIYN